MIAVAVNGEQVTGWTSYEISVSINDGASQYSMKLPFRRQAWDLFKPDRQVTVLIDGVPIVTGPIDSREVGDTEETIAISGRDWVGRLVDESAPLIKTPGGDVSSALLRAVSPWFAKVTQSSTRNRRKSLGGGRRATATERKQAYKTKRSSKIEPGQTRWQIVEEFCTQNGLLAWSSGDGRELIVAAPTYEQGVQWRFFKPAHDSRRSSESNVIGIGINESVGDRYSQILCVGSGGATDASYGASVAARFGEAKNGTNKDGTGKDFFFSKRLVIDRDVQGAEDAREEARREMAKRDASGHVVTVRAYGHSQKLQQSAKASVFTIDTVASVEDERTGIAGLYLVTACKYSSSRDAAETTTLSLVRKGTELSL